MKKVCLLLMAALLGSAALSSETLAAGFRLPEQGTAAMSMGGAFVGQADDPTAVWYNPAGITQLDGTRMSAGLTLIYPVSKHENLDGTTDVTDRNIFVPVQVFGTTQLNDKAYLGLGINSPFGLSTHWAATSETSGVATLSRIKTNEVNPNVAYKISDKTSVAVGVDFLRIEATLERMLSPVLIFRLDGDGWGVGANAGVMYRADDNLNFGLSYRSRINVKVEGPANVVPLFSNSGKSEITFPDMVQFGASYKASDKLTVNADLDYTWWSTYDRLVIESNSILALTGGFTNTDTEEKRWKNVWAIRVGGQYRVSDQWKLRGGLVYDQNPVPSERLETSLPDSDREGITIGTGYTAGKISVDTGYMYLHFKTRHVSNSFAGTFEPVPELNGTYKSQAHLLSVTVAYKF